MGWDDRRIAEKLGYVWESYRVYRSRHPELGPIVDPVEQEADRWSQRFGWIQDLRGTHR